MCELWSASSKSIPPRRKNSASASAFASNSIRHKRDLRPPEKRGPSPEWRGEGEHPAIGAQRRHALGGSLPVELGGIAALAPTTTCSRRLESVEDGHCGSILPDQFGNCLAMIHDGRGPTVE